MIELLPSQAAELEDFAESFENSELRQKYFSSDELIEKTFFEFLQQKTILTARNGTDTVGFICYIPNGAFHSFTLIHVLTVIPEFRACGFGKQILRIFENRYIKDASKIFLVVADFNPRAKIFYEYNGYVQVGKIPGLYRPDIDEFLMMKVKP